MGLRFDKSRGVIRLVRWNIRELALMLRLELLKLAENIRSRNAPDPMAAPAAGGSHPSFLSSWLPAPSTEPMRSAERSQIPQPAKSPLSVNAPVRRILLRIAITAALFLSGYLTGRLTIFENAPTSNANAGQAQAEPPAPEPLSPLVWVSQVTMLQETSSARPSEATSPKPVSTPIRDTRPLSSDEVLETQAWLNAFGFYSGPLDGLPGPQTTDAVKRYRTARQMEETSALDRTVLQQVRQQVGQSGR
jgi:Putative peptidoglycan binding domain